MQSFARMQISRHALITFCASSLVCGCMDFDGYHRQFGFAAGGTGASGGELSSLSHSQAGAGKSGTGVNGSPVAAIAGNGAVIIASGGNASNTVSAEGRATSDSGGHGFGGFVTSVAAGSLGGLASIGAASGIVGAGAPSKSNGGSASSNVPSSGGASLPPNTSARGGSSPSSTGSAALGGTASGGVRTGGGMTSVASGGIASSSNASGDGGPGGNGMGVGGGYSGGASNSSAQGGASSGSNAGASAGGTVSSGGARGAGYWAIADWFFQPAITYDWHGCTWTAQDLNVVDSTTTVSPLDFTLAPVGGPFRICGHITANLDWLGWAMVGFSIAGPEPTSGGCPYDPLGATKPGPPEIDLPLSATGIAVNFSKNGTFPLRIQIQGTDSNDATKRWCYAIPEQSGPAFVPFSQLYQRCWNVGVVGQDPGAPYAGEKIASIAFVVPGSSEELPYDLTIYGFGAGTSVAAAPTGVASSH